MLQWKAEDPTCDGKIRTQVLIDEDREETIDAKGHHHEQFFHAILPT